MMTITKQDYNLDFLYKSQSNGPSMMGRIINALVEQLNDKKKPHLPRYIVILLDIDLIVEAKTFDFGARDTFEQTVQWLLNNIIRSIDTRKNDLRKK